MTDGSRLERIGVVEGFYGAPWSFDERLDFFRWAAGAGLEEYLYAPKDDPYHRARWQDPYPDSELARLATLVAGAADAGIRFTYAIHPGLTMRFADDADHAALAAKARQLWGAGVRAFALLFDDVPLEVQDAGDRAAFGEGPESLGRAHARTVARFAAEVLAPLGAADRVLVCPTDYAGIAPSPYRDGFRAELPGDALVLWTGSDIVVGEVTRADIDAAADAFGRDLVLWDNFPVNDFDRTRLFLGPLLGRTSDVAGSALVGILSNPMVECLPSRFALATVAEWAHDPAGYDTDAAAARALDAVAGDRAEAVAPLVAASSSWPPSAPRHPRLSALLEHALDGDTEAIDALEHEFRRLAATGDVPRDPAPLDRALEPWLLAASDAGMAGLAACAVLRRLPGDIPELDRAVVRAAVLRCETRYHDVLRTVVPPFVREVLARAGDAASAPATTRTALLLTGENPAPGDRELAERLQTRGVAVTVSTTAPDPAARPDVVIVTSRASDAAAAAVAELPVPLLAWGRAVALGLATGAGVLEEQLDLEVGQATVRVHRSPGKITWVDPLPGAEVLGRLSDGRAAIVRHPAGFELPSGRRTPAERVVTYLAGEGAAPWLLTPEGHAIVLDAVDALTGANPSAG